MQCTTGKYSYFLTQNQNCWSRFTFTCLLSVLERKSCYYDSCSRHLPCPQFSYAGLFSASLVVFSACSHILCLFLLAFCLSMSTNMHVCARICAFHILVYVTVCLYFTCNCFLLAALKSCKYSNFFWHVQAIVITTVQVWR